MAIELKVPSVGESIAEVEIGEWMKSKGDVVQKDEPVVLLESEKATVDLLAPATGRISEVLKKRGETAAVGEVIGFLEEGGQSPDGQASAKTAAEQQQPEPAPTPVPPPERHEQAPEGKAVPTEKPSSPARERAHERQAVARPSQMAAVPAQPPVEPEARDERVQRMTRLRRTVAERLVRAQHDAALLTTFNEIDMSGVQALRKELGEAFLAKHGVKLGLMSFFVKASVDALTTVPQVNAEIRGEDIVYHIHCDVGVAIGGGKGLVVPVVRNAERLSFAEIGSAIADYARRAKENQIKPEELLGGTFTISNGGVYGSLLSTPIVNPPQSGVLGMHAIQERPVAHDGQVVVRPMMYVALTYDHRLVDGREAITFLKRIKETVENPVRMLLGV